MITLKKPDKIFWICNPCGNLANALSCFKRFGAFPDKPQFDISTWHDGKCDCCGKQRSITEVRDFFYPDFSLIEKVRDLLFYEGK